MSSQQSVSPAVAAQNGPAQPSAAPKPQAPASPSPESKPGPEPAAVSRDPAILLLDQKRRIVAANPPCATLFGHSQHALTGVQLEALLKADTQSELQTFLQVAGGADRGEYKATMSVTILRRDGTEWPTRVSIKRLWHHPQYCWTVAFPGPMPPTDCQPSPAAAPAHTHTQTAQSAKDASTPTLRMAEAGANEKTKPQSPAAQAKPQEAAPKAGDDRATLIQRIYTSEMKLSAAQDELKEANTSLDALQREYEGVAAAKADAEQQLEELRKIQGAVELARLKAELKKQSEDRQRAEKELRGQLDEAKTAAEQQKREGTSAVERAEAATHHQSQDRQRVESELLEQKNAAKAAAEQSAAALKEKEAQSAHLEEELTKVRLTRNELEQKQQKISAELENVRTELQQQTQERQRVEKELRDQQNVARTAAEEREAALKDKESEGARQEEELTKVRRARDEFEQQKREVATELERVKAELQQQAQDRQRAEAELQNSARTAVEQNALALKEKEVRHAQLEEELAKVRQARDEFEQQQRKTAADLGRIKTELQQHSHDRQRAEAELREELNAAKSVADETANMLEEKIARCHQLEEDLAELRRLRDDLEEQQRQTATSLERVRIESQQLSQDRQRAETELRGKLDAANAAAEKNAADLRQTENRCVQLEEELAGLRPMCAELQQQLHQSVQDLERARAGFQRQSQDRQRLEAELRVKFEAAKTTAEQKESRCAQLEEELAGLRPMCGELQQQLHQSIMDLERAKGEFHQQVQQRRRVERDLCEQLESVKAAAAQATADNEEKAARCNLFEEALIGVRRVRDELEQEKDSAAADLERAKAELQRQSQDRQRVEADLRAHLGAAKAAAEESATVLKEKEAHWARQEGELAQARQTRDEFEQGKQEAGAELERARAELQQHHQDRQRTEADLRSQLDAAKAAAEQSASILNQKEARWTRLEEELAQARQTLEELEQRRREGTADLERAKTELQQQSREVETELRSKLDAVTASAEKSASVLREKEEECARLQGELTWAREIREEVEQHKQAGAEELERAKAELERQVHERERIEADLRKQLDVADSAAESNVSALKEQEGRLTTLEGELSKARRTRDEFEQHQRQSAAELERLKTELRQLSEELHEWESECQKLTDAREALSQELSGLRESAAAQPATGTAAPAAKLDACPAANEGQLFRLRAPSAIQVYLAGDFTDWREAAIPMQKDRDGEWTTTVDLPPGTYNYLFIVDREWCVDPECRTKIPNQFGGQNSVRRIA